MFTFEIVVNQGGKSCFSVCVTQQTQAAQSFDLSHCQHLQGSVQEYVHINTFMFTEASFERVERSVIKSL